MMDEDVQSIGLELFESQNEIIALQSKAIRELFSLLYQHAQVEEAELASVKQLVDEAAEIRAEHRL